MEIKILAMDLDGTLTNEKKEITPKTIEALMKAQHKGLRLVLASGRPPYGMRPLARQLEMEKYGGIILCYNGGHVESLTPLTPSLRENPNSLAEGSGEGAAHGNVLVEIPLNEEFIPQLLEFQKESGMTLMTYYEDTIYTMEPDNEYVNISAYNNKMKVQGVKDFVKDTPRPLNKCLMVGAPEIVPYWEKKMQEVMNGKMHILHSTPYFIELLPLGIDKGPSLVKMLSKISSLEGLVPSLGPDNMMAFGDSYNDLEMLRLAGIGVAMGNAEEEVKSVADYVTDDNDHDGIAKALQHYGIV